MKIMILKLENGDSMGEMNEKGGYGLGITYTNEGNRRHNSGNNTSRVTQTNGFMISSKRRSYSTRRISLRRATY